MPSVVLSQLPIPCLNFGRRTGNIPLGAACLKQAAQGLPGVLVEILPQPLAAYLGDAALLRRLDRALGFKVTSGISDGVVPTLSQVHGRVLHAVRADHLDVVGHYTLAGGSSGNWLPSGAGFTREAFDATWDAVAAAIAKGGRTRR